MVAGLFIHGYVLEYLVVDQCLILRIHVTDEPFTYELDIDAQNAALIEGSLTLTPLQRTLVGGNLVIAVDWRPLRPVRTSAALIIRKQSGGR